MSWVKVTVATFKTRKEAEEFIERKRREGDVRPYKIEKRFYPLFGEERWEVYVFSEAKKHWLFRDLPEVPLRGTLVPYIEAARVKPIEEFVKRPKLKPEDTGKLADYFLDKLREAGVPLPTRFKSEFEKALDINKSYEENLKILDEVIARIIAKESGRRVHPLEEFRVVYTPHLAPLIYDFQYKVHGRWDTKGFKSFEEIRDFLRKGIGELYVHAFRGKELVTWEPIDLPRFTLEPGERVETANFIYTLEQPFFESTEKRWIWRVGVWDKVKQESKEIEMSEDEWRKLKESVKAVEGVRREGWRTWIKPIYEWIREKGWVKEGELYEEFKKKGVSEGDIKEAIHYLIRTGSIYTPREGFLKPT